VAIAGRGATVPAAIRHLPGKQVLRHAINAKVVEAEPADYRQHHRGNAGFAVTVDARVEIDAPIGTAATIQQLAAALERLRMAAHQPKTAQNEQRVSSRSPLGGVDPAGPAAIWILQGQQARTPTGFPDTALFALHAARSDFCEVAKSLPGDGGVALQ